MYSKAALLASLLILFVPLGASITLDIFPDIARASSNASLRTSIATAAARGRLADDISPPREVRRERATIIENAADLGRPVRLRIPSIGIDSPIDPVGLNSKGEMDVPSGSSNTVGWYKDGTLPGMVGSAVMDAHVFAAFRELKRVTPGTDIYVDMSGGTTLRFVADGVRKYRLDALSPHVIFDGDDAARLNLVTCAGTYVPSRGTYDHRLIVFGVLANT